MKEHLTEADFVNKSEYGDYVFSERGSLHWDEALAAYFDFKDEKLNPEQRTHVKDILNQRIYNRRLFRNAVIWLMLLICCMICSQLLAHFAPSTLFFAILLLLNAGVLAAASLSYRKHPYNSLCWMLPVMISVSVICFFIWLI